MATPSQTRAQARQSPAAFAAFYANWLDEAFDHWQPMFQTKADLAAVMKPCAVCALGTGNYCDGCRGPICTECERNEEKCPACGMAGPDPSAGAMHLGA